MAINIATGVFKYSTDYLNYFRQQINFDFRKAVQAYVGLVSQCHSSEDFRLNKHLTPRTNETVASLNKLIAFVAVL